ncbi:hypothetical protein EDD85DRAFT_789732 [Armillaria nabsnona]|nr:hypothetical protein EDD85DRAFT_789732 [Armillaria nabsnona]
MAWAWLTWAWAHWNFKPSPSHWTGLGSGRLGLKPRLFSGGRYVPIEQWSTNHPSHVEKPGALGRLEAWKTPSQALSPQKPLLWPGTARAFTELEPELAHHYLQVIQTITI